MTDVTAKITSKGQLTLPREVRDLLGVQSGDRVRFELESGAVRLYPERDTPSFRDMLGTAPLPAGQDALGVVEALRHGPAEEAALRAAPAHPHVTLNTADYGDFPEVTLLTVRP